MQPVEVVAGSDIGEADFAVESIASWILRERREWADVLRRVAEEESAQESRVEAV